MQQTHLTSVLFELNLGWNAWKSPWLKKATRWYCFFCLLVSNQQWKNDISVVLFSYGEKIHNIKRKMLVKCVCFCAGVPFPCLQVCVVSKISTARSTFQIYSFVLKALLSSLKNWTEAEIPPNFGFWKSGFFSLGGALTIVFMIRYSF